MHPIVDTEWLARESGPGLRVVDVRWYLDPARSGREAWRAGHIPGAAFVDVDRELSAPGGGRGLGAGPMPGLLPRAMLRRHYEALGAARERPAVAGDEPG